MTIKKILTPLVLLALIPGCMKQPKFKPLNLTPLAKQSAATYEETNNGVTIMAKKLNKDDCTKLFDKRAERLFKDKKALCPIQLSIENKQSKDMVLAAENIDLSLADSKMIAKKLHSNTFLRSLSIIGACGLFILPFALLIHPLGWLFVFSGSTAAGIALIPCLLVGGLTPFVLPFIIIPDAAISRNSNRKVNADIQQKVIGNQLVIKSNETRNILLFVEEKNYRPAFSLSLINQENSEEKTTFNINL